MKRLTAIILFALVGLLLTPASALADGIIIPEPPICDPAPCFEPGLPVPMKQLVIRYHHVDVTIRDQVAVTHVDQVFFNPNDWTVEGTYLFPLPVGAAVSNFTLWIDGEPVQGEVLEAEEARRVYEDIVRRLVDPALLEYAGQNAVRARVFPIPPGGERRIELEYTQALTAENGLVRYIYPLNTEKFSLEPLESVRVRVDVRAAASIRAVYSPSHTVEVDRLGPDHIIAAYEANSVIPDTDFALYYSLGEEQALHLLSFIDPDDPADPDGFFTLLLAPRPDVGPRSLSKDVLLVLDRSGSMEGEKFRQAQDALVFILENLNPEDRFNIVTFSTGIDQYARGLQPASAAPEAIAWVERLSAAGSTDINRALLEAAGMAGDERPTYLIFLTDGLPTEGVTDSQMILDNLARTAPEELRLFAFGVGYDVDTFLLDSLAQDHHGSSSYVLPGERLDETLSAFYARISTPVLTNLDLDFGDLAVFDLYPQPLPDLFAGSQLVLVGRYREGGRTTLTLTGEINGQRQTFRFPDQQFASRLPLAGEEKVDRALPRLWATRKIGHLLNRIRLQGPDQETVDQIVKLSIRYGIVTPYTSYLVTEEMPLGLEQQDRIVEEQFRALQAQPTQPTFGESAVERADQEGDLAEAQAPAAPASDALELVRIVGARTFVLSDGVWVDTAFDPQAMAPIQVAFLSDDYFSLVAARPDLAAYFALGGRVIALSGGSAYEVVGQDAQVDPLEIQPTAEPVPPPVTPVPPTQVAQTGPDAPRPETAPGTLPCLGGLLPLAVLPVGLIWMRRRQQ